MPQRQQTWKTTANNFKHEELHFYFCKMFFCTVNWSEHEACKFESGLRNVFQQCNEKKTGAGKLFRKARDFKGNFCSEKNVGISRIKR